MHFTILSRGTSIYSTKRLVEAARSAGHRVRVVDPAHCELKLSDGASQAAERGRMLARTDVVIPRVAASVQPFGLAVLNQLQLAGIPSLNEAAAIAVSRDKMRCLQLLASAGVPVPPTVMARDAKSLRRMVADVGGPPVLVKLVQPSDRAGIILCESEQSLEAALEAVLSTGRDLIVQRYTPAERWRDVRTLVVGGRVVAAVRRRARAGRLSTTLSRGAHVGMITCPPAYARLAERAAAVVGLEIAAVDMLETKAGPCVFEVSPSPGLQDLEQATNRDLATLIMARAAELGARKARLRRHG